MDTRAGDLLNKFIAEQMGEGDFTCSECKDETKRNAEIDQLNDEITNLKMILEKAEETAVFYRDCSGNKSTLKFGYSRVIEELVKHKLKFKE